MDGLAGDLAGVVEKTDDYPIAFVFGLVIILFFAWDQFNRPSYEAAKLVRLIEMLTPSTMRRRDAFLRAYAFYAGMLVLVYVILCTYGLVLAPILGWEVPGYFALDQAQTVGASHLPLESGFNPDDGPSSAETRSLLDVFRSDPKIPLVASLTIVGLASVPRFRMLEQKIRLVSHQLSGIPTRVIAGAREMHKELIDIGAEKQNALLIPHKDWQRYEHYKKRADGKIEDYSKLRRQLGAIFAFRAWVLQNRLSIPTSESREDLANVEKEVDASVKNLISKLDHISEFETASASGASPKERARLQEAEQQRVEWEAAAQDVDRVSFDVALLSMLFVEHGILSTEETVSYPDETKENGASETEAGQRSAAEKRLRKHLSHAVRYVDSENFAIFVWFRATVAVLVVSFLVGTLAMDSRDSPVQTHWAVGGTRFMSQAAAGYVLALLAGISWHQDAYQSKSWNNVFLTHWIRWLFPLSAVFLMSGLVALVGIVGLNMALAVAQFGVSSVWKQGLTFLRGALIYDGPRALLAANLSVFVVVIIDAWRARKKGANALTWLPGATGGVLFVLGVLVRMHSSSLGLGSDFSLRSRLVWKLAVQAGVWACLVGLTVAFFVRTTLQHMPSDGREHDDDRKNLRWIFSAFAILLAILPLSAFAQEQMQKPVIKIGVRTDTPPFAWQQDDGGFSGYIFHLCVDATVRAGYLPDPVPITAAARKEFFEGRRPDINLLCDPTTITISRMRAFLKKRDLEFSPIIFVANGSYVENENSKEIEGERPPGLECIVGSLPAREEDKETYFASGFVGETTAERTLRDALAVQQGAQTPRVALTEKQYVCLVEKKNHWEAAEAFCRGELHFYFGDEDILRQTIDIASETISSCPDNNVTSPLSYEPYALVISSRPEGFREDFIVGLYSAMHFESTRDRFQRSFPDQRMSPFLNMLFRMWNIPVGDKLPEELEIGSEGGLPMVEAAAHPILHD